MFSTTVENLKCSYALSQMCWFNDVEKPGTFVIPGDRDGAFKTYKNRGRLGKIEASVFPVYEDKKTCVGRLSKR